LVKQEILEAFQTRLTEAAKDEARNWLLHGGPTSNKSNFASVATLPRDDFTIQGARAAPKRFECIEGDGFTIDGLQQAGDNVHVDVRIHGDYVIDNLPEKVQALLGKQLVYKSATQLPMDRETSSSSTDKKRIRSKQTDGCRKWMRFEKVVGPELDALQKQVESQISTFAKFPPGQATTYTHQDHRNP
jgi:hypothetical protein